LHPRILNAVKMIRIDKKNLSIQDFEQVIYGGSDIEIAPEVLENIDANFDFLSKFSKNKIIYGINTGLGPMSQYRIDESNQVDLQLNLIRSHAAGSGNILQPEYIKAAMLARLNTLSKGYSGVNRSVLLLLVDLINKNVNPVIFEHGGVGASGDLVQLAQLALVLIGEGEVIYEGKVQPTPKIFEKLGLKPIEVKIREGLGLINGTSVMSGIGILNRLHAQRMIEWSLWCTAVLNELVESYDDHFSKELNQVKLHPGQQKVASIIRDLISDSSLIRKRHDDLYEKPTTDSLIDKKVQEYYSLRCVPQITGAIVETLENAGQILINEVNSVNDNPIIDHHNKNVFHGGNFHGDYISLEMDKMKIAITKLCMLAERQLNFLMNDKINGLLPPFVNTGTLGLNLGMQGAQFTATSTTAENQTLCFPMYVHSIPNNNDNQDIVSMGTNSALITKKVIENTSEVMAVEIISILQAIDHLKVADKLSAFSQKTFAGLRKVVPYFTDDHPKYPEIKVIKDYINTYNLGIL
jgi:histidine ammonia-lyase